MNDLKQRIFDLAKNFQLINFATTAEDGQPRVRYVIGKADPTLTLRFSTHLDSNKISQLKNNRSVFVTMGATTMRSQTWLQIEGIAEVSTTNEERQGFWFDELKAHFTGLDDPRYCIVIIKPTKIELASMAGAPEVWQPHGATPVSPPTARAMS
jgi:general stress protein 26